MYLIASSNGGAGLRQAMAILCRGGRAVDAVETAVRAVEANPEDHSVGVGGYPNLVKQVELDAGIMQGHDLTSGAVGALQGFAHPISVARRVMEVLPHVFLVGEGAARFAAEMGFPRTDLLTEAAEEAWARGLQPEMTPEMVARIDELPDLWRWVEIATDPERIRGTVNVIARDAHGQICVGVSTSGWAWKYPGRLGDSPVVGAGFYADDRYGAAACTGTGEMAIRACTAHSVVTYLKLGMTLEAAGHRAMVELNELGGRYLAGMNLIAVDHEGHHVGFSSQEGRSYLYLDPSMEEPAMFPRIHVPLVQRWQRYAQGTATAASCAELSE